MRNRRSLLFADPPLTVSDEFWAQIEPFIPAKTRVEGRPYRRQPGAGRKPIPARRAFEAIVYVLRTGTPWKALPSAFGSASAVHRYFGAWLAGGFFRKLWETGLAEHAELEGIAWQWHAFPSSPPDAGPGGIDVPFVRPRRPRVTGPIPRRDWQPSMSRRRSRPRVPVRD